jgi:hypothetical protein
MIVRFVTPAEAAASLLRTPSRLERSRWLRRWRQKCGDAFANEAAARLRQLEREAPPA